MTRRVKITAVLLLIAIIAVAGVSSGLDLWAGWHFRACEHAVSQGDYAAAKRHLDSYTHLRSENWVCRLWRIRLARLNGRLDEAERLLATAGFRSNDIPREILSLESLLIKAQRGLCNEQEETELRELVNQDHPDRPLLLHALVLGYLRLYRLHDAEDCLTLWLEAQPDNVDALAQLGKTQERLMRFRDAIATYRQILGRTPDNDEVLIRTVSLLVLTNQLSDATDLIERCSRQHAGDPRVQLAVGIFRYQQGKTDEAIRLLDALLEQEPLHVRGLLARGKIALQGNDPSTALPFVERALKAAPRDYQALFLMADCLIKLGKTEEGVKMQERARGAQDDLARVDQLTKTLQERPNDPDLRCEIGVLLISFGDVNEGRTWIQSALHFDPNHAGARRALAEMKAAPR